MHPPPSRITPFEAPCWVHTTTVDVWYTFVTQMNLAANAGYTTNRMLERCSQTALASFILQTRELLYILSLLRL